MGVFSFFNNRPQNMNSLLIFYVENRNKINDLGQVEVKNVNKRPTCCQTLMVNVPSETAQSITVGQGKKKEMYSLVTKNISL